MPPATAPSYRPDIDGLRALAVAAVILNHLSPGLLPSGYLGVDIFFVISGFVIATSLEGHRDRPLGDFLLGFYARRVRRLAPALILLVVVASFAIRLFDPSPMASIATGVAALAGASNLLLYSQAIDYFGQSARLNLFSHTWSLGVEEQFYLLVPVLLRWRPSDGVRRALRTDPRLALLAVLTLASLAAWIAVYPRNQPAAYFLTPFRFWELGAGCLLALSGGPAAIPRWVRRVGPTPPLVATIATLFITEHHAMVATPLVVAGTAAVIVSMRREAWACRLLTLRPVVYVGLISYSLYLWHWVVICLSRWTIGIHLWSLPLQLAAMLVLAAASFHWVETPIRRGDWKVRPDLTVGAGLLALGLAAALVLLGQGLKIPRFSGQRDTEPVALGAAYEGRFTHRRLRQCFARRIFIGGPDETAARLERCAARAPATPLLIFIGDSHAGDLFPVSEMVFHAGLASVLNVSESGCQMPALPDSPARCRYFDKLLAALPPESRRGAVLVVRNNYAPKAVDGSLGRFKTVLEPFLDQASAAGLKVVYVLPAPHYPGVGPESLCSRQWFRPDWAIAGQCRTGLTENRAEQLARRRDLVDYLRRLQSTHPGLLLFDPFDPLCGPPGKTCSPVQEGRPLYRDISHLTEAGAERLTPSFVAFLRDNGLVAR